MNPREIAAKKRREIAEETERRRVAWEAFQAASKEVFAYIQEEAQQRGATQEWLPHWNHNVYYRPNVSTKVYGLRLTPAGELVNTCLDDTYNRLPDDVYIDDLESFICAYTETLVELLNKYFRELAEQTEGDQE